MYSVPVPIELSPYASYPVGDISLCRTSAGLRLGYSLPALLIGKKERVSFEGAEDAASGKVAMSGQNGAASCETAGSSWSCAEVFSDINVDLEEVAKEAEGLDAAETAARLEVARRFAVDPIGLLEFPGP